VAITPKATGTWAELVADGAVAIPGTPAAGDRMFVFATWKAFGTTAQITAPQAWTEITEFADGAVAAGANVGSVKVGAWYRDWVSGDGNPTLDFSVSPAPAFAVCQVWQKAASDSWDAPTFVTQVITAATPFSATSSATLTVKDGAVVFCLTGLRDDSATWTRDSNTALDDDGSPAVTWNGNVVESPAAHGTTTTSNDLAVDLVHRMVTTGAAGVNLTTTGTPAAAETGAALWVHQGITSVPATNAAAGVATGTGSAEGNDASLAPTGGIATGTGAAANATVTTGKNADAGVATGTGLANDADPLLASNATAGLAAGTGAALQPSASVAPTAGSAAGTGAALNATAATAKSAAAGTATGTGAAQGVDASIAVNAIQALGTGTASGAMGSDQASAIIATGTGQAHDAVASTATFVSAAAGVATGTGAAQGTDAKVAPGAQAGSGTGSALNASALVSGPKDVFPGVATGTGTAHNATADTGVVVAPPARRPIQGQPNIRPYPRKRAEAGLATGKGRAFDASISVVSRAGIARGSGTAHDAATIWNDDDTALFVLLGDLELAA
jgi:hypothetical protein